LELSEPTKIASTSLNPEKFAAMKRKWSSSGKNTGHL